LNLTYNKLSKMMDSKEFQQNYRKHMKEALKDGVLYMKPNPIMSEY